MRHARGYTLLEVVIAFGVLAFALTLLLGILSNATRQVRWSAEQGRAALAAQSLLDRFELEGALREGRRSGQLSADGMRWSLDVQRWRDPARSAQPLDPAAPRLLHVRLYLQWGEGGPRQQLAVDTLRAAPAGLAVPP